MSTAVAAPPASTPLGPSLDRIVSPRPFSALQSSPSSGAEPAAKRVRSNASPPSSSSSSSVVVEHPHHRPSLSNGRTSPTAYPPAVACHARDRREDTTADAASASLRAPAIQVKKEPPTSPPLRPRPKRLDLSSSSRPNPSGGGPHTSRPSAGPLTSRDSAGLAVQDVGLACLSPGFQTNDPGMREQLQRSLDVRDQQRQIISARQKGGSGSKPGSAATPAAPRRKGPPPGLTISAPSAAAFAAQDRVIQSAPMNQTFTGLRPGEHPFAPRPVQHHGPSGLSQNSHIYHVPATQTSNRLPPLADVFGSHHHSPPAPPPPPAGPTEYRSAEEAVQGLSGGREDLLPKVVHYGGSGRTGGSMAVPPPTPPSPLPPPPAAAPSATGTTTTTTTYLPSHDNGGSQYQTRPEILGRTASMNGRRRGREEFESSSPLASDAKRAALGSAGGEEGRWGGDWTGRGRKSDEEKREEFLRLCGRAWDLFHS
ncbi:MAG: hypothetical protein FE78DRAFT_100671 [Acidomyces sp. 'richmondensis']|nr:MAG: hypothetical protein FE78DRAFT_100671 [Acidomyces sp. 'richmondensis']